MGTNVLDLMDLAVSGAEKVNHIFGQCTLDAQAITWTKANGTQLWSEGMPTEGLQVQLTFRVNPLDCTGSSKIVEKQLKSGFGDWQYIVWPSLKALGITKPDSVDNKWVHVENVPQRKGSEWMTWKFHGVYATEAECVKAWEKVTGSQASDLQPNDAERAAALQFLPHIVEANKTDMTKLEAALKSMSPLNKYFNVNSPEVVELLVPFGG